jgi:hypothetical protein
MNVIKFQPQPERYEMRCGACDGALFTWHLVGDQTVLCCMSCPEEYTLPNVYDVEAVEKK